tara:strand:- start:168 stop:1241 length:1074 start_codon:yes stop_codon:yes gene_type:complete
MERFVFNVPGIGAVVVISSSMGLAKSQLQARFPGAAVEYSTNADRDPAMPNGHVGSSGKTLEQLLATSLFDPKIGQSGEIVADGRIVTGPSIGRDVASSGAVTGATTGGNEIGVGAIGTLPAGFTRPPEDPVSTTIIGEEGRGMPGGADLEGVPLSEANRFASFLRNLGQRGYQQGTLGRTIQEKRYAPAQAAFFGEEALAGLQSPDRTPGTFESFLTGAAPGLAGLGGRARSAFGSLADLTSLQPMGAKQFSPLREGRIYDTETGFDTNPEGRLGTISAFTNPDFENSNLGEQLANLALQSGRSSFAPIIANQLYRSDRFSPYNLKAQFQGAQGTSGLEGGGQGNFVDFLRTRFGL